MDKKSIILELKALGVPGLTASNDAKYLAAIMKEGEKIKAAWIGTRTSTIITNRRLIYAKGFTSTEYVSLPLGNIKRFEYKPIGSLGSGMLQIVLSDGTVLEQKGGIKNAHPHAEYFTDGLNKLFATKKLTPGTVTSGKVDATGKLVGAETQLANPGQFGFTTGKPWYRKWWGVILAIIIWPIFLTWFVWARTHWRKPVKWLSTAGVVAAAFGGLMIMASLAPPSVTVSSDLSPVKAAQYALTGTVYPEDSQVTVNGRQVTTNGQGDFHTNLDLTPGDNQIVIVAISGKEFSTQNFTIHRYTKAELAAQAAAAAKKIASRPSSTPKPKKSTPSPSPKATPTPYEAPAVNDQGPADPVDALTEAKAACDTFESGADPVLQQSVQDNDLAPAIRLTMGIIPTSTTGQSDPNAPYTKALDGASSAAINDPKYQPLVDALNQVNEAVTHQDPGSSDFSAISQATAVVNTQCGSIL